MEIIFIGKEWKFKKALRDEILKELYPKRISYKETFNIDFTPNDDTIIVTSPNYYPLVTRILATKTNKNLIVKENQLIPENAKFSKNSFLIKLNNFNVNVILLKDKIPEILFLTSSYEEINLFRIDKETVKMLIEPIFSPRKIEYTLIENEGGFIQIFSEPLNKKIKKEILDALPFTIFGNIFEHIIKTLPPKKITFAESCTGGLIASTLTKYAGASNCFDGSVISYSNDIKSKWLGVSKDTLKLYGAVSEQTVKEMLQGALEVSDSDYAIAVSGIAGPGGGTKEKPVGTVYIGVADKKELKVEHHLFKGDRNYIQYQAMMNSIRMFINLANLYSKEID